MIVVVGLEVVYYFDILNWLYCELFNFLNFLLVVLRMKVRRERKGVGWLLLFEIVFRFMLY